MATFFLWSTLGPFFATAQGPITGRIWGRSNESSSDPIWTDDATAAAGFVSGAPASYDIDITAQDWLGEQQPVTVTIATTTLIAPFDNLSGVATFSRSGLTQTGGVYFWTASATTGAYDLNYETFTENLVNVTLNTPAITLSDSIVDLNKAVKNPTSWNFTTGSSNTVFGYSTAVNASTENIYFQAFDFAGHATSPLITVASGVADSATDWFVGQIGTQFYFIHTVVGGSAPGVHFDVFDPVSGAVTPGVVVAQAGYTSYFSLGDKINSSAGQNLLFTEGIKNSQHVIDVSTLNASYQVTAVNKEIVLSGTTGAHCNFAEVYDPSDGYYDRTVLAYTNNGQVYLELLDKTGTQIGSDFAIPGLSSYDRLVALGSRVEIDYTVADGGSTVAGYIYDTATAGRTSTISGNEYVGTPFDDTYTDTGGVNAVNGGGGTDTVVINYGIEQGGLSVDAVGHEAVVTPLSSDRLDRITTVSFADATFVIAGGSAATDSVFASSLLGGVAVVDSQTTLTLKANVTTGSGFAFSDGGAVQLAGFTLGLGGTSSLTGGTVGGPGTLAVTGSTEISSVVATGVTLSVDSGGHVQLDASLSGGTVTFGSKKGSAKVLAGATLGDTIAGFATGDTIDLAGLPVSTTYETMFTATAGGGTLKIVDTAHADAVVGTFSLSGSYASGVFTLTPDGGGGMTIGFDATPNLGLSSGTVVTANIPGGAFLAIVDQYNSDGVLSLEDKISKLANGDYTFHYAGGSFFTGKPFQSFDNVTDASGTLLSQTLYNAAGFAYQLSQFNANGSLYLQDTVTKLSNGNIDYHFQNGSFFTGKPFQSFDNVTNASGTLLSQTLDDSTGFAYQQTQFNANGSIYLQDTVSKPATGQLLYHFAGGSFFTGKGFSAFDNLDTTNNTLLSQELDGNDGSHSFTVPGSNLTLTAAKNDIFTVSGSNDTVRFNATGFGADLFKGYSAGDIFSFATSIFPDFSSLSQHVSGTSSAIITDAANDTLTLNNVAASSLTSSMFKFA